MNLALTVMITLAIVIVSIIAMIYCYNRHDIGFSLSLIIMSLSVASLYPLILISIASGKIIEAEYQAPISITKTDYNVYIEYYEDEIIKTKTLNEIQFLTQSEFIIIQKAIYKNDWGYTWVEFTPMIKFIIGDINDKKDAIKGVEIIW